MFLFKKITVFLCFLALVCLPAKADLIDNWDFILDSGFTGVTGGVNVVGTNDNTYWTGETGSPAPSQLSWGTGGTSSFDVGAGSNGHFEGSLMTGGSAINTVIMTHNNQPINAGTGISGAVLSDRIVLTPSGGGADFLPPALLFNIFFEETSNATPCAAPSPAGNPCNDIFVLDVAAAGFDITNNSFNQNFNYGPDDDPYNLRLFIAGVGVLSNAECSAAGVANGCIGFTTIEGQANEFQVMLDITTEQFVPVPEPATLFTLGLGLISLCAVRRRV